MRNNHEFSQRIQPPHRAQSRRPALRSMLVAIGAYVGLGLVASSASVAAPSIFVNDAPMNVDAVVHNDQIFVPVRGVFERLHTAVDFSPPDNIVARKANSNLAELTLGSRQTTVNGSPRTLNSPPFMSSSRVFVPLRLISEAAGASVAYDASAHAVRISNAQSVAAVAPAVAASPQAAPIAQQHGIPWWVWLLLVLVALALLLLFVRRRKPDPVIKTRSSVPSPNIKTRP